MNMKFNYKIFGLGALMCCSLASCELDYAPENTLVDENVYTHSRTAEAALMGAYVRLNVLLSGAPQDQNNTANNGYTYLLGDLGTENLAVRENVSPYEAIEKGEYTSTEHDGFLSNMWSWGYNAIDMANNVIAGINEFGTYDEAVERQHIAEAKFIRAYCNFALLTIYGDKALLGNDEGLGIIIRTEPYSGYNPDDVQGRNTNADCWNFIIRDLTEAIPDLSAVVPAATDRVRANQSVARALLSRVYLYKGTYTNNVEELTLARNLAQEVLGTSGYEFSASSTEFRNNLFPSNEYSQSSGYPDPTSRSNELLFFEPSRLSTALYPNGLSYYRKQRYYVPQTMIDLYNPNDLRCTYLIGIGSTTEYDTDRTSMKYAGGSSDDVIYLRLSEVKLAYAEAAARVSGDITTEALQHLNDVRQRAFEDANKPAPYVVTDFASLDDFIKAVLTERRLELCYEGLYRWDLVRTNNMLDDAKMKLVDPARWNMPVPDYEIRISYGKITQNSGYVETEE